MPITIDSRGIDILASDIEEAVAAVAAKHGVEIKRGRCMYAHTRQSGTVKLEVAQLDDTGVSLSPERTALDSAGWTLKDVSEEKRKSLYGQTFTARGTRYRITGYNVRARKRPFLAVRESDGTTFCFPADSINRVLQ